MKMSMTKQSAFEQEIAALIVEHLNIEDTRADEIDPEAALFNDGLGLDSIDALELALAVSQTYGVHLRSNNERGVDPLWWTPDPLGRRYSPCRDQDRRTRRSSGAR